MTDTISSLREEDPDIAAAIDAAGGTAELHVLDGVGHLLHYERPAACAALIRDWLRRAGR